MCIRCQETTVSGLLEPLCSTCNKRHQSITHCCIMTVYPDDGEEVTFTAEPIEFNGPIVICSPRVTINDLIF